MTFIHPKYDFFRAHIDGEILGDPRGVGLLECKNVDRYVANSPVWGEAESDEVPEYYLAQNQAGMRLTTYLWGELAALIGGNEPRIYPFVADAEFQDIIVERVVKFWECLKSGNLDALSRTTDDIKARYPKAQPKLVTASEEHVKAVARIREITKATKDLEDEKKSLQALCASALCDADTLVDINGAKLATFKTVERAGYTVDPITYREFRLAPAKASRA